MLHLRILTGFWIHPWDLESYQAKRLSNYTHWMLLLGGPIRNETDFLKTRWSLTDINLEFFPFKLKIWSNIIECALSKIRINKTNKFSHCLFFEKKHLIWENTQLTFTCSKLIIETVAKGGNMSLTSFWSFYC